MSEDPPEQSAEPLFGQAGLEHDAGYKPLPQESAAPDESAAPEELTVEQAAEQRAAEQRASEAPASRGITYVDGSDLADNITLTLEQGAEALESARAEEREQAESEEADELRDAIDKLRAENKPAESEAADESESEPNVEKALNHPAVRAAIEGHVAEAEHAKGNYALGLEIVRNFAANSFAEFFPEIANLPLANWKPALEAMAQREPQRFRAAVTKIQNLGQLDAAREAIWQREAVAERAKFAEHVASENARFAEMTKGESPETMRAVEAHLPKMLTDAGVDDPHQFMQAIANQSRVSRAAAGALLVKAAKYDLMMQNSKRAATKAVPPVQRPGTRMPQSSASEAKLSNLAKQFATATVDGQLRIAAEALTTKRAQRARH